MKVWEAFLCGVAAAAVLFWLGVGWVGIPIAVLASFCAGFIVAVVRDVIR